jgi:hypothetical protein
MKVPMMPSPMFQRASRSAGFILDASLTRSSPPGSLRLARVHGVGETDDQYSLHGLHGLGLLSLDVLLGNALVPRIERFKGKKPLSLPNHNTHAHVASANRGITSARTRTTPVSHLSRFMAYLLGTRT